MSRRFQQPKRDRQPCPTCGRSVAIDRLGRYHAHGPGSWRASEFDGGGGCEGSYRMAAP